jgi:hypothetical protein
MANSLIKKVLIMYCLIGIVVYSLAFYVDDLIVTYSMNYTSPLNTLKVTTQSITNITVGNMSDTQANAQNKDKNIFTDFGVAFNGLVGALLSFFMVIPTTKLLIDLLFVSFGFPPEYLNFVWGAIIVSLIFSIIAILRNQET